MLEQQCGTGCRPDLVDDLPLGRSANCESSPPPEDDTYLDPDDFEQEWAQISIMTQYIRPTEIKRFEELNCGRANTGLQTELNTQKLTLSNTDMVDHGKKYLATLQSGTKTLDSGGVQDQLKTSSDA